MKKATLAVVVVTAAISISANAWAQAGSSGAQDKTGESTGSHVGPGAAGDSSTSNDHTMSNESMSGGSMTCQQMMDKANSMPPPSDPAQQKNGDEPDEQGQSGNGCRKRKSL